MKEFTAFQYLCIDIANQFDLDKLLFEERIQWVLDNIKDLELLGELKGHWKERPLYVKAVQTLRKVQKGEPTGHIIHLDAVCSGKTCMPL